MAEAKLSIPDTKQMFEAGVHFGHETRRWNPKMKTFIHSSKGKIHVFNLEKTVEQLEKAANFLVDASSRGEVIFVGTKNQASEIVKEAALSSGAHYVVNRWAGGVLTNFKKVGESFRKLQAMQKGFEEGVEDRTKYEVTLMKKEWGKLNRLYEGINKLASKPTAVIVVDAKYEKGAVREARKMGIPVVGIVDTNSDPDMIDYVIPGNDDAIASIRLIIDTLAEAVKAGNKGIGIKYALKDYSKAEVQIKRSSKLETETKENIISEIKETKNEAGETKKQVRVVKSPKTSKSKFEGKGILERVQKENESKKK